MIACPVCGEGNNDLATICVSCRGYVQSKVDALDLFSTCWNIVESPRKAFRRIALATHKNYTYVLAALFGIAWVFTGLWVSEAASLIPSLAVLMLVGFMTGPLVGIAVLAAASTVAIGLGRRLGGNLSFRNSMALTTYSMLPVVLSLVFAFPVDLAIFGPSFFGAAPGPWELKPMIYLVLLVIHGGALLWSLILLVVASAVAFGVHLVKGLVIALVIAVILSSILLIPLSLTR